MSLATAGQESVSIEYWRSVGGGTRGNQSPKLAITVDPDVHRPVVDAAAAEGVSVSKWVTTAARRALKVRDGLAAVTEWEAEHRPLTIAELDEARRTAMAVADRRAA
jgi:hypothetical protein